MPDERTRIIQMINSILSSSRSCDLELFLTFIDTYTRKINVQDGGRT